MALPNNLSPSQVGQFLRCQLAWRFAKVDKVVVQPPMAFLRGKALDEAASAHYLALARGWGAPTGDQFVAAAGDYHDAHLGEYAPDDVEPAKSRQMVEKAAVSYWRAFCAEGSGQLRPKSPTHIQMSVKGWIRGVRVPILGYVDLVTDDGLIVDTKYKERMASQWDADRDLQLGTYALLLKGTDVAFAVATPGGKAELLRSTRSEADLLRVEEVYRVVWTAMQAGHYLPADPSSWQCGPKYCQFWGQCEFGGGLSEPAQMAMLLREGSHV